MTTGNETDVLIEELEHFKQEQEKIRSIIGQIGGSSAAKRDRCIHTAFFTALVVLLVMDVLTHLKLFAIPFPPLFSIEIAILLVSLKIIFMIRTQTRVAHFQFWILNSIEFRLNDISRRLGSLEKQE